VIYLKNITACIPFAENYVLHPDVVLFWSQHTLVIVSTVVNTGCKVT